MHLFLNPLIILWWRSYVIVSILKIKGKTVVKWVLRSETTASKCDSDVTYRVGYPTCFSGPSGNSGPCTPCPRPAALPPVPLSILPCSSPPASVPCTRRCFCGDRAFLNTLLCLCPINDPSKTSAPERPRSSSQNQTSISCSLAALGYSFSMAFKNM